MKYGLIAKKLSHSFSKEIHGKLFDYDYELHELAEEEVDAFMRQREFCAINVTLPYKETVIPYLDEISDMAKQIGAVNTVVNRDGKLIGYNTDFSGMVALIRQAGIVLKGKKVLVLGSGGTSKTAMAVANHLECKEVYRVSRSGRDGCITYETAAKQHKDAQVIINTTPCGMYPDIDQSAVDVADYPTLEGVVDAVYNPLRSKLVCDALERNIPAVGGLYMLVAQAVYAAEKFVDKTVPEEKIQEVFRQMMLQKQNIVLIGMPGCGKTTVGKALAQALGAEFIDTDEQIVAQDGRTIPQIFEQEGEKGFRDLETEAIRRVAARQHAVIATGGGAVLRKENVRLLRQNGRIYFVDRPLDALETTPDRPLSCDRQALERRYRERYDIYLASCQRQILSDSIIAHVVNAIKEDFEDENFGDQRT